MGGIGTAQAEGARAEGLTYRFVPDAGRLEQLFARYEEERRRAGLATQMERVTPAQRIDAVVAMLGLNGARGWHRRPDESGAELWLRYLTPVLAETRQSAAALAAAAREGLPGTFDPPIDEPRPRFTLDEAEDVPDWHDEARTAPPSAAGLLAERLRNALRRPWVRLSLALGLVLVAALALHLARPPADNTAPDATGAPVAVSAVRPAALTGVRPATVGDDPFGDDFRRALTIAMTAQAQDGALTPRQLAALYAGESDVIGEPAIFLAAMRRHWPLPPDEALPSNPAGALALIHYAWAFVAAEHGAPTPPEPPPLDRATPEDQMLQGWLGRLTAGTAPPPPAAGTASAGAAAASGWPAWLAALPFLPVAAALAWGLATFLPALIAALTNPEARRLGVEVELPAGALALTAPPPARRLARQISWQGPGIARRIHADRSVRATVRAGGFPTIVRRREPRSVHYLFLVPRLSAADHERERVSRFIEAIARGGLSLDVYDYDPDPRTLMARTVEGDRRGGVLDLRALRERHAEARLVLVTDGAELVDYFTQRPHAFVAGELALWPRRMLLTPVPPGEWAEREFRLAQALGAPIGRATPEGFQDLIVGFGERAARPPAARIAGESEAGEAGLVTRVVDWLEASEARLPGASIPPRPDALRYDDPMLTSDAEPPAEEQAALIRDLRHWLGPAGFHWLAATAAYPQLRFAITLYLGLRLSTRLGLVTTPLFDERRLAQLSLLPWFRRGHMPPWLRRALFAAVAPDSRRRIREAVDSMINGDPLVADDLPAGSHLPIWRPEPGGREIPVDAVMADLWLADRSDLAPLLRGGAFARLFRDQLRQVAATRLAIIGLALAWSLGAFFLWPSAAAAPHAPGVWFPLIAYGTATALVGAILAAIADRRRHRLPQSFRASDHRAATPPADEGSAGAGGDPAFNSKAPPEGRESPFFLDPTEVDEAPASHSANDDGERRK